MSANIKFDGGLTCASGVSDLDKAINWYQETLGFKLTYKLDEMGWCELDTHIAGVSIGLSVVEELNVKGGTTLTFGVNDIDAARVELEDKGVKFDGETQTIQGMVKLATFFDPDGNTLMFYQSLGEQ